MWPWSTIRRLKQQLADAEWNLVEANTANGRLRQSLFDEQDAHNRTLDKLEQASKNDTPRGPKGRFVKKALADKAGVTMVEYGLIAAGIAVVLAVVLQEIGTGLNTVFTAVNTAL